MQPYMYFPGAYLPEPLSVGVQVMRWDQSLHYHKSILLIEISLLRAQYGRCRLVQGVAIFLSVSSRYIPSPSGEGAIRGSL